MTYQQIAQVLGVSHQAVWEIEKRAINKIRKQLQAKGVTLEEMALVLMVNR